jgi:hypothetical protein
MKRYLVKSSTQIAALGAMHPEFQFRKYIPGINEKLTQESQKALNSALQTALLGWQS